MSRHQDWLDGPEAHLEYGMKHIAYDADTEVNTYRDLQGNLWDSKPGNQYGPLKMTHKASKAKSSLQSSYESGSSSSIKSHSKRWSDIFGGGRQSEAPPPAYPRRRRFTSFDMLDQRMIAPESNTGQSLTGVIGNVSRSLSVERPSHATTTSVPQRRSTVSTPIARKPVGSGPRPTACEAAAKRSTVHTKSERSRDMPSRRATVGSNARPVRQFERPAPIQEDEEGVMGKLGRFFGGDSTQTPQRSKSLMTKRSGR